jgi:hypothetical protein
MRRPQASKGNKQIKFSRQAPLSHSKEGSWLAYTGNPNRSERMHPKLEADEYALILHSNGWEPDLEDHNEDLSNYLLNLPEPLLATLPVWTMTRVLSRT